MRFFPLLFIVFVQFLALVGIARYAAPTTDEWGHLPSGLVHWIHGSFVPYRVNPPFVRMIASAPVLLADYQILAISRYDVLPGDRNEFRLGRFRRRFETRLYAISLRAASRTPLPFCVRHLNLWYCWLWRWSFCTNCWPQFGHAISSDWAVSC